MWCWSCKAETMEEREDKRFYECPCGATENYGGASLDPAYQKKLAGETKKGGKKK